MSKQSSIDWLVDKVTDMIHKSHHAELIDTMNKAREMHRQEVTDAYRKSAILTILHDINTSDEEKMAELVSETIDDPAEHYYNETFNHEQNTGD